jgi:hypothetical protein
MMKIRRIGHIDAAPRCSRPGRAVFGSLRHSPHRKNRVIDGTASVPVYASTSTS